MVGHTLRYDPRYLAVQTAVKEGKLGELIHIYTRRNATVVSGRRLEGRVEAAIFQGVHDLDFCLWITGSKIVRVYAESISKVLTDLHVSDTVMATLRFENGTIGLFEQSWGLPAGLPSPLDAGLEVVGTQGAAYLDLRAQSISMFVNGKYTQPDIIYGLPDLHFLMDEHSWFVAYLNGEVEPKVSGEEAFEALRVADAIVRSSKTGEIVRL
jgi:predicted dehydrogenase